MLERRHYDFLADALKSSCANTSAAWDQIVNELTEALAHDNPRFDPRRFKAACGKDMRSANDILSNVVNLRPVSRVAGFGYGS
jgi:hypothetical protein